MDAQDGVRSDSAGRTYFHLAEEDHFDQKAQSASGSRESSGDYDRAYADDETEIRTSLERRQHDYETLTAEEEAERLLLGGNDATSDRNFKQKSSRQRKKGLMGRRKRSSTAMDAEGELLFKAEKGGRSSSEDSHDSDSRRSNGNPLNQKSARAKSKRRCCCTVTVGLTAVVIVTIGILFIAYMISNAMQEPPASNMAKTLSNGTHIFKPTTILISLDGFRADFLNRGLTPTLQSFIKQGVSPEYMMPSFPSVTFPNHFTLATGLYPEAHGIVGNTFWDPTFEKEFYYTDPARSMSPEWWNAEPIWVTAEKHDLRSAIHMWPGSEAHIGGIEPTYLDRFNSKEHLDNKVRQVINWLDLPGPEDPNTSKDTPRPQLIAFYVPDVDSDGHAFGPNSTYIRSTIAEVDGMLGKLVTALDQRNLTDIVNVVVVSDHGMATTSTERLIQFEDLIDPALIAHTDGWPLYGLRPVDPSPENLQKLYNDLLAKSLLPENKDHFKVYLRDTNMPPEYHFSRNPRIAPLWIVPAVGWAIVTRSEFNLSSTSSSAQVYHPRGLHGYDHTHPLMRAIFAARGPAFSHHLPAGTRLEPFQNIEVYNLVCDSLGIPPVPNNGTLRLPFTSAHAAPAGPASTTAAADYEDGDISAALEVPHGSSSSSSAALDDSAGQILPPTFPVVGVPDAEKAPGGGGGHDDAASPALSTLTGVLVGASPPSSLPSPSPPLPAPVGGKKKTFWEWMREKFNSIKNWGG